MIKNLNLVVALTAGGRVKVLHAGIHRGKAIEVFNAADEEKEGHPFAQVVHIRDARPERRKRPLEKQSRRAERQAEADAAAAEAAEAEAARLEAQARENASLAAIELAEENGIGIYGITGTGEGGRVLAEDVAAALRLAAG